MANSVTLMIGTTKGLFVMSRLGGDWRMTGPHCDLWPINHATGDPDTGRIWAAGGNAWHGAGVWRSEGDGWALAKLTEGEGETWLRSDPKITASLGMRVPGPSPLGDRFEALWSICHTPSRLYAGAKPATLLASDDGGETWQVLEGLTDHPSARDWNPGAAGLTLHSIVPHPVDPKRFWVGISAAGVFATEDGGQTWDRRNRLSNAGACTDHPHPAAPRDGETGHCVHNMVRAAGDVDLLYQQNHHGVWRSCDGGRSWDDITAGLPSTFGFPVAVHPDKPDTIWTLPLNGDSAGRYPPDAAAAVWRSRDGGNTWQPLRNGLPQQNCFFTVLRQGMAVDDDEGLYFGTNTGSVFASQDEGDTWSEIALHLPTVLCVEAMTQAE